MNRSQHFLHTLFASGALTAVVIFAVYWFRLSHVAHNFHGWEHVGDFALFAVVSFIIWLPIVMKVLLWAIASHIKPIKYYKPEEGLKVAFITTFVPASESISLLHKTLPAMVKTRYPHDTWLLDEGNDPEVIKVCEQYGVKHFSRAGKEHYNMPEGKYARKTKGGNHNSWYDVVGNDYDIVAEIDTDFIPHPGFLQVTLGFFRNPKIAFVGTPQIYGNIKHSIIARGAAQQTYSFYGPLLRGMAGMNSTLLIGANHVIRVKALQSVDHYSAHITEDLITGMKLHAKGWESVYVPQALAIGEGPTDWKSYFNQQKRWAYGCMHILFNHSFKLFKTMSLRRSMYYFVIQQYYFTGLAMALSVICLTLYFGLGIQATKMDLGSFLALFIPLSVIIGLMSFWLQRFNIRPKEERGIMWSGMYIGVAAWPIFFLAFASLFKRKKLVYKVTPKGTKAKKDKSLPFKLFLPHLTLAFITLADFVSSFFTHRTAPFMLFWALLGSLSLLAVPLTPPLMRISARFGDWITTRFISFNNQYRILEFGTADKGALPKPPDEKEKYIYVKRKLSLLLVVSLISFTGVTISMTLFIYHHPVLWSLAIVLAFNIIYYATSFFVNAGTRAFDIQAHKTSIASWKPDVYPSVDIFLPNAGEDLRVLENTWDGITAMADAYKGRVTIYCLDDADRPEVKTLAEQYNFIYEVRPDRGYFKKAGNLRHGFRVSNSEFIVIFDADFVPRADFLNETLPYFSNPKTGIVQTPQYFSVTPNQNWLERGAGAVQELFYRFSQVSRESNNASICVGSNAVYRRKALESTGGTALIEHSEDVHTGFNLRMKGWSLTYIPIVLAKGLCPATMPAFFKQQYRWCMGSMSLLSSAKFWHTKLSFRARLSYMSGFFYYIQTGLMSFYTPIIPLILLIAIPAKLSLVNYFLIFPAFIFTQIVYPLWHKSIYGVEAWTVRSVYGWAHLFAIADVISNNHMSWQPTGTKVRKDRRYTTFRVLQFFLNFSPAVLWVTLAAHYFIFVSPRTYAPILISGIYYLCIASKVTFYTAKSIRLDTSVKTMAGARAQKQ